MATSIINQAATVLGDNLTDYVSEGFDPESNIPRDLEQDISVYPFLSLHPKKSPEDLAEEINHSAVRTGATILILDLDNDGDILYITNKFYLQGFQMQFQEKVQLLETFDTSSVSFFGDTAKVYHFAGSAMDYPSQTQPYKTMHQSSLLQLYDSHLRGTQLVENNNIAVMKIMNHFVYGYPMNMNVNYSSGQDKLANFSISWVVTSHELDLSGIVNQKQLEGLYSAETQGVAEDVQQFVRNLEAIIVPISNLLIIDSKLKPSVERFRSILGQVTIPGIDTVGPVSIVDLLAIQRSTYDLIKSEFSSFFDIITEQAEALIEAIGNKRENKFGYISPKLYNWNEDKLSALKDKAQRINRSWDEYTEFKTYLKSLADLKQQLIRFKTQIISGS